MLIHPISFEEVLRYKGQDISAEPRSWAGRERSRVERSFLDWSRVGGFPEAQGIDSSTRRQLFRDYVDVAMFRDVVERHDVRNGSSPSVVRRC